MEIILTPGSTQTHYWRDLWRYRDLFHVLARRDIAVRYKQTVIGIAWAVLRPALTVVVFTIVFGRLANLPSEGATPYPVLVLVGLLPWAFFSTALTDAANSLAANANLVSKVYFPRMIVPAATIVAAFVDFLITFGLLLVMMGWYGLPPTWRMLWLPVFTLVAVCAALGPGLWLTALNVKYRDFRYIVPFILQIALYISPVGFSSAIVPDRWRALYSLNPLVGVIDGFRWCILGGQSQIHWPGFALSLAAVAAFGWAGVRRFRRTEAMFADLI